jgi:hypothetical protein
MSITVVLTSRPQVKLGVIKHMSTHILRRAWWRCLQASAPANLCGSLRRHLCHLPLVCRCRLLRAVLAVIK